MNLLEFEKLKGGGLSHLSRSLYMFYLRPQAERGQVFAHLNTLAAALVSESPVQATPFDLNLTESCLLELETAGLIARENKELSFEGQRLSFPLYSAPLNELPQGPFAMHDGWRPGPSFAKICTLTGLPGAEFDEADLSGFIGYWTGRRELRNQNAWERAFASRLLKKRQPRVSKRQSTASSVQRDNASSLNSWQVFNTDFNKNNGN